METEKKYIIYTGSPDENPNHFSDESDYYAIGIERNYFRGTKEEARKKGAELAKKRREEIGNQLISVSCWIEERE